MTTKQEALFDYEGFVEKFKPKKTTDDCYTPPNVYEAVKEWACAEYGIDPKRIVRPFYPGGDYERFDYPDGCVVLDNPPFSILSAIKRFYVENRIPFFLFAPTLTLFNGHAEGVCFLPCGVGITYANGAEVNTSFVTNLDSHLVICCPELRRRVAEADEANRRKNAKELPKYEYPAHVLTAAKAAWFTRYGIPFELRRDDAVRIPALDAQKVQGKGIFGSGFLLSEKAAAEKAAARVWMLSDREREIVSMLGEA